MNMVCEVIGDIVPVELKLSKSETLLVAELLRVLENLEIVTKTFQKDFLHLCYVREYLDVAIVVFLELETHC